MLDDLVILHPITLNQLLEIEGFGIKRVNDYGKEIVSIFQNSGPVKKEGRNNLIVIDAQNRQVQIEDNLKERLTAFRLSYAKNMNVKPYYVFKNSTLELLLEKRPVTVEQLLKIDGFGPKKVEDFGEEIINIIKRS